MGFLLASLLNAAALPLAVAAASPAAPACDPIPGWDRVLADSKIRWIVIGELHGTAETPAIFADAVCLTAKERGPVVVALEMPSGDQAKIDAFMASDGGRAAQAEFFTAMLWHMPMKDGRSSEAFFNLFERLRQMHREGRVARVVAFQDSSPAQDPPDAGQGPYEGRLAAIGCAPLAGVAGLEPAASGFGDRRSSQLSYTPAPERTPLARGVTWAGAATEIHARREGKKSVGRAVSRGEASRRGLPGRVRRRPAVPALATRM